MFTNYLKIAWRRLNSNRLFSSINIVGLALGMAVVMLIGLWIDSELTFDKNFEHYDRIAQVMQTGDLNGELLTTPQMPVPLGAELRSRYGTDFEQVISSSVSEEHVLAVDHKNFMKTGRFMDTGAPAMLNLHMLEGTRSGLHDAHSILLSRSLANVMFGGSNADAKDASAKAGATRALGKSITFDDTVDLRVTGVYDDLPLNSSFADLAYLTPWSLDVAENPEISFDQTKQVWTDNPVQAFVELKANTNAVSVSKKIEKIIADQPGPAGAQKGSVVFLHPMSGWHLYSDFRNGKSAGGGIQYVWLFGCIGLFILLLACINFMNLSTARSARRSREVGVRKAIGSSRGQLMGQFFIESMCIAFIAFLLCILFVQLALPAFNQFTGKELTIPWQSPVFWLSGIGVALITGLIAGSYPALYLSAFQPVKVLKSSIQSGGSGSGLRKILVTVQFSISLFLIIATVVVFQQIRFARNRPVGYDRSGLVLTKLNNKDIYNHFDAFRQDLLQTGAVAEASEATSFTTEVMNVDEGVQWEGWDSTHPADITMEGITYEYGKTIDWQVKAGRDYSRTFSTDAMSMVINESAARIMNLRNPVGKTLRWLGAKFTIIGVVSDMVMGSPYSSALPTVYYIAPWWTPVVNIRLKPGAGVAGAMSSIEKVFKKYDPSEPFTFKFADAEYDTKFRAEQRVGNLATLFCSLAIFISCLGLFGLVSFITEQRTKEVSVRKVLGASVFSLWSLLSKEFVLLVLLSDCIAMPVAWYFMHAWLQHYSYRTGIQWWIFGLSAAGALTITLATVSFQAIKAALANPVRSLRRE